MRHQLFLPGRADALRAGTRSRGRRGGDRRFPCAFDRRGRGRFGGGGFGGGVGLDRGDLPLFFGRLLRRGFRDDAVGFCGFGRLSLRERGLLDLFLLLGLRGRGGGRSGFGPRRQIGRLGARREQVKTDFESRRAEIGGVFGRQVGV